MKNFYSFSQKFVFITLFMIIATLIFSCSENKYVAPPPPVVTVATPIVQDVVLSSEYPGYTEAHLTVELVARIKGYLQEVNFQPGSYVNVGDTLFVIEPRTYLDAVDEAKADLDNAKAALKLAKATEQRIVIASESDAVSELDVLQANAGTDQAIASLKRAEASLSSANVNLDYCYVVAPCSGRITKSEVDRGNLVGSSGSQVLATIYQDNPLFVYFNIEDKVMLSAFGNRDNPEIIRPDNIGSIFVSPNGEFDSTFIAKVDYIAPNIDLETGTVTVRAKMDNNDQGLSSGLFVKIKIPYRKIIDAILIPEAAISTDQSGRYLLVVNDSNTVIQKQIEVGQLEGEKLRVITNGISKDDLVIINGLQRARHGIKVTPKKTTVEKFINN